jgi:hypothetical protein
MSSMRVFFFALSLLVGLTCRAQTVTILASFTAAEPNASSLILGADGNFYGTAGEAGFFYTGTASVFKATPAGAVTTLYNFPSPLVPNSLLQGTKGTFYGTMAQQTSQYAGGVFSLSPDGYFSTLYSFSFSAGYSPSGVILARDGNFYGSTQFGGTGDCQELDESLVACGTIFQLDPLGTLQVLYTFA